MSNIKISREREKEREKSNYVLSSGDSEMHSSKIAACLSILNDRLKFSIQFISFCVQLINDQVKEIKGGIYLAWHVA